MTHLSASAQLLDEIRQTLNMMREHELAEFELERENLKLRLRKQENGSWAANLPPMPLVTFAIPARTSDAAALRVRPPAPVLPAANEDVDLAMVKAPIVGTFYRSAKPGAKPFVEIGQTVKKGQVLGIIEAIKLIYQINAECDGDIVKVYVENGQAVQYGERLFAIEPA
jgi:acetyl-CoA carboxylase biotin carboxyl carrier protein